MYTLTMTKNLVFSTCPYKNPTRLTCISCFYDQIHQKSTMLKNHAFLTIFRYKKSTMERKKVYYGLLCIRMRKVRLTPSRFGVFLCKFLRFWRIFGRYHLGQNLQHFSQNLDKISIIYVKISTIFVKISNILVEIAHFGRNLKHLV